MTPKLIILNGFAGSGKSTLAEEYIEKHPLSMNIEGDKIIAMIGGWKKHYYKARDMVFPLTKAMTKTYLEKGHDVIIPYLLKDIKHAQEFEKLAQKAGAGYFEICLYAKKEDAIDRLMKRGTWGEEDLPPLTKKDLPHIEDLFERMERATAKRPNTKRVEIIYGDIETTYNNLIKILNQKN